MQTERTLESNQGRSLSEKHRRSIGDGVRGLFKGKNHPMYGSLHKLVYNKNGRHTEEILGYTKKQLKETLESKFLPGMSWKNHGDWHIDHIKSIKAFLDEGITDPSIINALDNLQPLWVGDNLRENCYG